MSRTLYVDLDYTLGFFNAAANHWTLYDGAHEALKELEKKLPLVLLTANMRVNVETLFKQLPEIKKRFTLVMTCEDFAPHFVSIGELHREWIASGKLDSKTNFLEFVHLLWSEEPIKALPVNAGPTINPPLDYQTWEKSVYFPTIAPNKAKVCGAHGFLIDDEFANPSPNPIYKDMIAERRAFFSGRRGGTTADAGPEWNNILKSVFEVIE